MFKSIATAALFIAGGVFAQNGAPASPYYNGFNFTQTGTNLKNALATKIDVTHTNDLDYGDLWPALRIVDQDPANPNNVLLVYGWESGADNVYHNDRSRNKFDNGGSDGDWNREHTYPQSLGTPVLGSTGPGADAHHLRASDVQRNNMRGNLPFAPGSGNSGTVPGGWYPGDEWKGDVARMILYMYLRYGSQCLPKHVATGSTVATDSNVPLLLLQWNADDPVSPYEDQRNTYLGNASNMYGQGNRNPFIDNPYLATLIWGGPVAQNRWPFLSVEDVTWTQTLSVYPIPSKDGSVTVSSSVPVTQIEVYNTEGRLVKRLENAASNAQEVLVSDLPRGFFLLRLVSEQGSTVRKIVIQ